MMPRMPGRADLLRTLLAFVAFGVMFGAWQVLLADLAGALGIGPPQLGAALAIGFVPSIPASLVAGRLVGRFGLGPIGLAAALLLAACQIGFGLVSAYPLFVLLTVGFFAASSSYDVAINAAGIGLEAPGGARSGARLLSGLHAGYSFGGMIGALSTGALLAVGLNHRAVFGLAGLAMALGGIALAMSHARRHAAPARPRLLAVADDRVLLALAGIASLALLAEGAMESWSSIYMRDGLGLSVLVGASGVAIFHAVMSAGRLVGVVALRRISRAAGLAMAGSLTSIGMLLGLSTLVPGVVILGFAIVAAGLSLVFPILVSWAGERRPTAPGAAAAAVISLGYAGFVIGPALIGGIAAVSSLRAALLSVAVCGALIVVAVVILGAFDTAPSRT